MMPYMFDGSRTNSFMPDVLILDSDNPPSQNGKTKEILALGNKPKQQVIIEQDTFTRTVRILVSDKAMPVFVYQDEKVVDVIAELLSNLGIDCVVDETWDVEEIYSEVKQ